MKPWLTEICERVNARRDTPPNTQQDALDVLDATFASYVSSQCGDLISCLIERCEQLQQALEHKPGACQMLSLGDGCDCTLCKQSREIERLRRLEEAASTMYYTNHGSPEWDTAYNMLMEAIDEREEAEKARDA